MTRLGRLIAFLDGLPRELLAAPDVGPADVHLVADHLGHACAKCRALADMKPEPTAPGRPVRLLRATARSVSGRAA